MTIPVLSLVAIGFLDLNDLIKINNDKSNKNQPNKQ